MSDTKAEAAPAGIPEVGDVKMEEVATSDAAEASASTTKGAEVKQEDVKPKTEKISAEFNEPVPKLEGKDEEEVQKLLAGAAKQIGFYFSDSNLPTDRYLFTLTCCNEPLYGWVPIQTLISFSRMREPYQALGVDFVTYALRQSIAKDGSDPLLGVSEDGKNVRRVRALERDTSGSWSRSVYVKGFGEESKEAGENSLSSIQQYFEQFGEINAVRLRREDKDPETGYGKGRGKFKGSVFVEFKNEADAKAFLEKESIPKFLPEGDEMLKMSKQEYVDKKTAERKAKGLPVDPIPSRRGGPGASTSAEAGGSQTQSTSQTNGDAAAAGEEKDQKPAGNAGGKKGGFGQGQNRFGDKFNAYRELDRMRKGLQANLASIPDTVAIVGKRPAVQTHTHGHGRDGKDRDNKRRREGRDEEDEKPAKVAKTEPFEIDYNGTMLKCDRETGKILEPSKVPYEKQSCLKFVGAGEKTDWKDLKAQIIGAGGIAEPFLAAPPKEKGGKLAKKDGSSFSDAELQKLRDAKLLYGGVEVAWDFMNESELQDFWALRASFQGGVAAKKLKLKEEEENATRKAEAAAAKPDRRDRDDRGGRGGRGGGGGGRGRGGRGGGGGRGGRGGRGGNRGGNRDRENRGKNEGEGGGGGASGGVPPKIESGGD